MTIEAKEIENERNGVITPKIDDKENCDLQPEMKKNAFQLLMSSRKPQDQTPTVGKRKRGPKKVVTEEVIEETVQTPTSSAENQPLNNPRDALEKMMGRWLNDIDKHMPDPVEKEVTDMPSQAVSTKIEPKKRGRKKKVVEIPPMPVQSTIKPKEGVKDILKIMMQNRSNGKEKPVVMEIEQDEEEEIVLVKRFKRKRNQIESSDSESEEEKPLKKKGNLFEFFNVKNGSVENSTSLSVKKKTKKKKVLKPTIQTTEIVDLSISTLLNTPKTSKRKPENETLVEIPATPDTPSSRPRRSCTAKPISYRFDSLSPDKKKFKKKSVPESPEPEAIIITDEDSITPPIPKKLAPIFQKSVQKPNIDPEVLKARRAFLESGLPETIITDLENQKRFEDYYSLELSLFPSISHVAQTDYQLPVLDSNILKLNPVALPDLTGLKPMRNLFQTLPSLNQWPELSFEASNNPDLYKKAVKTVFSHFPTNRTLCQLKLKNSEEKSLFTEKYRPSHGDDFVIGHTPVEALKIFLASCKDEKRPQNDSDDDFEDSASNSSRTQSSNVVLLLGRPGSGKTSAVMALANELNFNVLEINAGQRRTGKKILQDLHEATQSHGVRKQKTTDENGQDLKSVTSKGAKKKFKTKLAPSKVTSSGSQADEKMSLILIEDADIVFDEDEGFLNAIKQLAETSKRPVILTAIEANLLHLQRYRVIRFKTPSPLRTAKYLTVLAMNENYQFEHASLQKLVERNGGDVRKSILELQFYLQSGGDSKSLVKAVKPNETVKVISSENSTEFVVEPVTNCGYLHHGLYDFFNQEPYGQKSKMRITQRVIETSFTDKVRNIKAIATANWLTRSPVEDNLTNDLGLEISKELIELSEFCGTNVEQMGYSEIKR